DYRSNSIDPNKYFVTSKDLDDEADYEAKPLPILGAPSINNLAISRPALVACGQCGHRYSYKAPWCSRCGGVATEVGRPNIARWCCGISLGFVRKRGSVGTR